MLQSGRKRALLLTGVLLAAATVSEFPAWPQDGDAAKTEQRAAWAQIAEVLRHPRCLNCHQRDAPLQGDARRVHIPAVVRGAGGLGAGTMLCRNCHNQMGNSEMSGVPGAWGWRLAPEKMTWEGLSTGDLCRKLSDQAANDGRSPEQLVEHMRTERLVRWAWEPGGGRQRIPVDHDDFMSWFEIWVRGGATCSE